MNLKSRNKVSASFSMSSMTDIVFLLLIFFMVTSTMIAPNALKLLLPKSGSQVEQKAITSISIKHIGDRFDYAVETTKMPFEQVESVLKAKLSGEDIPTVALHADKSVPLEELVKIMNLAKKNKYKLILATSAN